MKSINDEGKMKKLAYAFLTALMIAAAPAACKADDGRPLPVGVKIGALVPAGSGINTAFVAVADASFALDKHHRLMFQFGSSDSAGCSIDDPGVVVSYCSADYQFVSASVFRMHGADRGLYHGIGFAVMRNRLSYQAVYGNTSYVVSSKPTRLGLLLTLGYGGIKGPFVEANAMFAGSKQISPVTKNSIKMDNISFSAGNRWIFK